jgi:hypothetical protein
MVSRMIERKAERVGRRPTPEQAAQVTQSAGACSSSAFSRWSRVVTGITAAKSAGAPADAARDRRYRITEDPEALQMRYVALHMSGFIDQSCEPR